MVSILIHVDPDLNTALHFGARNGHFDICNFIINELIKHNRVSDVINLPNKKGFTPLIEVAFRGYQTIGKMDLAKQMRHKICEKLLQANADPNFCKPETQMTALHLLAHNNDSKAIDVLLRYNAEWTAVTHDGLLPIDVAGTTPSLECIDTLLNHYKATNKIEGPSTKADDRSKKVNEIY